MMKLSTMLKIGRTVDADGHSPIAEHIMEHWEHDQGSVQRYRSSTNFVYIFRKGGERCFLRFADSTEKTRAAIEAEIDVLHWVAAQGMTVSTPMRSRNGQCVETVETDLGTFHAVVFVGLSGSHLDIADLDESQFQAWGAALGKLHTAMHTYQGSSLSTRRSTWQDHLELVRTWLPKDEQAVRSELEQVSSLLHALPITETNYGLIHFDFELDNLTWQDQTIGMLDFDDCAHYWYAADIAFALRDLFVEGNHLDNPSFHAFVRGYSEHYPLDKELLSHLPTFIRMRNLFGYADHIRVVDLPDNQEYPEGYTSLSLKLQNRMHSYKTALLSEK